MQFRVQMHEDDDDPVCPSLQCGAVQTPIGFDPAGGKAPAYGGSVPVRAMDATAEIVMQDYQMTDMRDVVRPGEDSVPKLPPAQQARADAMFDASKRAAMMGGNSPFGQIVNGIAQGAMTAPQPQPGPDTMATLHRARYKPKVRFVGEYDG